MIDKIIPRSLDSSLDLKLTPKNAMTDALNVSITNSVSPGDENSGNTGVIKNPLGNLPADVYNEFDKFFPSIHYQVIGSVTDIKTKIIYFFVYSSIPSYHSVIAYDPLGRLPKSKTVAAPKRNSVRLIMSSNQFKFPQNGFIKADIVHVKRSEFSKYNNISSYMKNNGYWDEMASDAIIYFTDNQNEPRKINAYRALLDNSQQTPGGQATGFSNYSIPEIEDLISACPRTPLEKIEFEFAYDEDYNGSNFKSGSCFTFAYQYVYRDGIESSVSSYSDLAVPKSTLTQGANPNVDSNTLNVCVLKVPSGNKEVEKIRLLARQYDSSSFFLVDEVDRSHIVGNSGEYYLYSNKILTAISDEVVAKQFDAVPKAAYTQTVSNNRLFYGNYVEGFDNVSVQATISPVYQNEPNETDLRIYITPSVRSGAIHSTTDTDEQKQNKNKLFDGGASFILDVDASNLALLPNSIIRFSLKTHPDRNFHIYKKNGWSMPSSDSNSAQRYLNEGSLSQPYPTSDNINDSYATHNSASVMNPRYYYYDENLTLQNTSVKIGGRVDSPLIIPGGQLTYNIEFRYNGPTSLYGQEAAGKICSTITNMLCGVSVDSDITPIITQSLSAHTYDLGLANFQKIRSYGPGDNAAESDSKAYLITPLFPSNEVGPPIGYAIAESAKVTFGFQKVSSAQQYNSINEILLSIIKIDNLKLTTCIKQPAHDSDWIVLKKEYIYSNQSTANNILNQFLEYTEKTDLNDFYQIRTSELGVPIDISQIPSNELTVSQNYRKQFGYVDHLPTVNFSRNFFSSTAPNQDITGTCVIDGEAGIGGLFQNNDEYNYGNPGSILTIVKKATAGSYTTDPDNPTSPVFRIGGYFFINPQNYFPSTVSSNYVQVIVPAVVNPVPQYNLLASAFNTEGSSFPLRFGSIVSSLQTNQSSPYRAISAEQQIDTHAYVEVQDSFIDWTTVSDSTGYRSFKTNSFHEFGVVYYDKRGRHGFVNPLKPIYIPGYSDADRAGGGKGKVDVQVQVTSTHPEWANSFKIVHSRSTSVERFVQYTAGGAFIRHSPQENDEENIYLSLNYLQGSVISYSSSFGARSPEGGLDLYKFSPGDRLKIISYQSSIGTKSYPQNFDFEVVDLVNLGEDSNPLSESNSDVPYNNQGYFLVLRDNPGASDFSYSAVKNQQDKWGNNCLIEIYTPSKTKDQSSKIFYELTNPISTAGLQGNVSFLIENGDVWWRPIAMNLRNFDNETGSFVDLLVDTVSTSGSNQSRPNFKSRYVESMTFTDLYKGDSHGLGRPNVYYPEAQEVRNESGIVYSQPTAQTSFRIKYSDFNPSLLNFKDIPEIYGAIVYMIDRGDSILCIQDSKCCLIPIGRNILSDASGNDFITSSTSVLGSERYFAGQAGCDGSPESVVDADGKVYFVNKSTGSVFAVSDGSIENISAIGMESVLRDSISKTVTNAQQNGLNFRIPAGYDPVNSEYIFTIKSFNKVVEETNINYDPFLAGCTSPNACNYNKDAVINDGSCIFPSYGYDCNGNCLNDDDNDGICNDFEVLGCLDPSADNYDPTFTENNPSSCIYLGCTDPAACNFDPKANQNDGSCSYPLNTYRDCNGNCLEFHEYDGKSTLVCKDEELIVYCNDNQACNYSTGNHADPSLCTFPEAGFNCEGNPSGTAIDDIVKHINLYGLTYKDLAYMNQYANVSSFYNYVPDLNGDGMVGTSDLLLVMSAYGARFPENEYIIRPSYDETVSYLRENNLVEEIPDTPPSIFGLPPSNGNSSIKLLHVMAQGGLLKSQMKYILDAIRNYNGNPEWNNENIVAKKWFEEQRVTTDQEILGPIEEDTPVIVNPVKKIAAIWYMSSYTPENFGSGTDGDVAFGTNLLLDVLGLYNTVQPDVDFGNEKLFNPLDEE
jgi:hypothetical protein